MRYSDQINPRKRQQAKLCDTRYLQPQGLAWELPRLSERLQSRRACRRRWVVQWMLHGSRSILRTVLESSRRPKFRARVTRYWAESSRRGSLAFQSMSPSLQSLNPFQRHKKLLHDLEHLYGGRLPQTLPEALPEKSEQDVIQATYRFVRNDEDDQTGDRWEVELARAYYAKLFREYAIVDLSKYKKGDIGCRWRTQQEVVTGKGQFECGTASCSEQRGLETYEVPFGYKETGVDKVALVKVRLCQKHALKLNYKKLKQEKKDCKRKRVEEEFKQEERGARGIRRIGSMTAATRERGSEGNFKGKEQIQEETLPEPSKDRRNVRAQVDKFLAELLL